MKPTRPRPPAGAVSLRWDPLSRLRRTILAGSYPYAATRKRLVFMNMLVVSGILAIMALAQWIVHAHGGAISVESEIDGGTSFTVSLPLLPATD